MDIVDIAIAKKLAGGGGGSSLPPVTSADVGKVLAVNASGEWAAGVKILTLTANDISDYTYNDMVGFISNGTIVVLSILNENDYTMNILTNAIYTEVQYEVFFGGFEGITCYADSPDSPLNLD